MERPNATQNSSTGMLASIVPVGVVPRALRWPSWNIHTSAPNAADNDSKLSTSAFRGRITLPVSRNSSIMVISPIRPSTIGNREVIAATLSRLTWAPPANSTSRPAGSGTACNRSSWIFDSGENSAAVLRTERNALPSATPVGADGGPTLLPPTNVPPGAETSDTSGTRDRSAAYRSSSAVVAPVASGITTLIAVLKLLSKSLRSWSPTWWAEALLGSTLSSGLPNSIRRNGIPKRIRKATINAPIGIGRRMTNFVERYQN